MRAGILVSDIPYPADDQRDTIKSVSHTLRSSQTYLKFSVEYWAGRMGKEMTRAKAQSTPSSEKRENIFLCALGDLAREIS
jgi:hypothetical protein